MDSIFVLIVVMVVFSLGFQMAAAGLALRLIPATGKKVSWSCVAGALALMAVRRLYSLRAAVIGGAELSVPFEFTGLLLSFLMLLGLWGIRTIIMSHIDAQHHARALAQQRETLLREVHHRIKNNMNTLRILLGFRAEKLPDGEAATALRTAEAQVESMMILYDKLYRSESVTHVRARDYLETLIREICATTQDTRAPRLEIECDDTELPAADSFYLGILLNEIIANAAKYAFPAVDDPQLRIAMTRRDGQIRITIHDNGPGLPEGFDWRRSPGFGMTLIQTLADQLKAQITVENQQGLLWSITYDWE